MFQSYSFRHHLRSVGILDLASWRVGTSFPFDAFLFLCINKGTMLTVPLRPATNIPARSEDRVCSQGIFLHSSLACPPKLGGGGVKNNSLRAKTRLSVNPIRDPRFRL